MFDAYYALNYAGMASTFTVCASLWILKLSSFMLYKYVTGSARTGHNHIFFKFLTIFLVYLLAKFQVHMPKILGFTILNVETTEQFIYSASIWRINYGCLKKWLYRISSNKSLMRINAGLNWRPGGATLIQGVVRDYSSVIFRKSVTTTETWKYVKSSCYKE